MVTKEFVDELLGRVGGVDGKGGATRFLFCAELLKEVAKDLCFNCRAGFSVIKRNDTFYHQAGSNFSSCTANLIHLQVDNLVS